MSLVKELSKDSLLRRVTCRCEKIKIKNPASRKYFEYAFCDSFRFVNRTVSQKSGPLNGVPRYDVWAGSTLYHFRKNIY